MRAFGLDPRAAIHHSLDLTGIPQRRQRRHAYRCACRGHELSTVRHARIQRRTVQYYCRRCGSELVAGGRLTVDRACSAAHFSTALQFASLRSVRVSQRA